MASSKSWSQLVSLPKTESIEDNKVVNQELNQNFVSLDDVMSEQLAKQLDAEVLAPDIGAVGGQPVTDLPVNTSDNIRQFIKESGLDLDQVQQMLDNSDCSCDELLAHLLQHELDRQHDHNLKKEEKKQNQNSKVSVSFDLYRRVKEEESDDSEDEFHEYGEESKHWDSFEKSEKEAVKVGKQGFTVKNGVVTTKHDLDTSARKNARRVMDFDLRTGDGGGFDMKLNNNVFNALKVHSISESKRMARLHEKKEKSTVEKVLDEKSRILVFKLVNRGILDTVNGIISTGKESVVLHGRGSMEDRGITNTEVAIKIFKTTLNEFKNRAQYIGNDPVLHVTGKLTKQNPKFIIPLWAEKEMHNLNRIRRSGILCPEVLILRKHVLVMTFIGKEGKPAPTLKEAVLTEEEVLKAWKQSTEMLYKLFNDCDLIHSDFSEYNLLWHEKKLWCIDVSQAVLSTHPMAFKFLWRDCNNIHKFFSKRLTPDMMSASELFSRVCGKQLDETCEENVNNSVDLLDKIENYDKSEDFMKYSNNENENTFEEMFDKSLREKQLMDGTGTQKPLSAKSPPKYK